MNVENIWLSFRTTLLSFILSKIHDRMTAEDVLQEVFIRIHLHMDSLRDETKVKPWLYQITRNVINDYYRKNKPEFTSENFINSDKEVTEDLQVMEDATRDMIRMMDKLPEAYCEALCLTELEGLSQKEYADKIGIPYSSAKSRVQRSRKILRDMLMQCCHYQFDKYGTVFDIQPKCCCCCKP
jgi:RNA polymerase sigma-70 factor (ECF subfamily)